MWEDIIKRSGHGISRPAINFINEVMADGEKRTPKEILDEIWNIVESWNKLSSKERRKLRGNTDSGPITGKSIPTIGELKSYLAKNYSVGIFHNETGEELPKTTKQSNVTRNVTRKYYR
tara:strand:+ start:1543 stop:1899 length:357 start_codon:yes stop_codon:yes gene_type:complete